MACRHLGRRIASKEARWTIRPISWRSGIIGIRRQRPAFSCPVARARAAADLQYELELLTQIARTHSLQRQFAQAHQLLDEIEPRLTDATPQAACAPCWSVAVPSTPPATRPVPRRCLSRPGSWGSSTRALSRHRCRPHDRHRRAAGRAEPLASAGDGAGRAKHRSKGAWLARHPLQQPGLDPVRAGSFR